MVKRSSLIKRIANKTEGSRPLSSRSLFLFLVGGAIFLYLQLFRFPWTPIFIVQDHWIFLQDAREMLDGRVLYRNIFQFTFPGTQVVYAMLVKLFGSRVWIPNAVLVILGTLLALLTTLISKRIVKGRWALFPGFFLLSFEFSAWHDATHHWFCTVVSMAAVMIVADERSPRRLVAAGALAGLAMWFNQSQGALVLLGLAVFALWECRRKNQEWQTVIRQWELLLAGFVPTVVLGIGYFVWKAGVRQFVWSTLIFPLKYFSADAANNTYRVYFSDLAGHPLWEAAPAVFVYAVVPLVYVIYLIVYLRSKSDRTTAEPWEQLMLLNIVGACMFLSVAFAPSSFRLSTVSPPALIILVWLLRSSTWRISRSTLAFLGFAAFLCASMATIKTFRIERIWHAYLNLPSGRTVFLDPGPYKEYQWLLNNTSPSDFFFGGRSPYFYYPLELQAPSAVLYVTANGFTRPSQIRNLIRALARHHVRIIMWDKNLNQPTSTLGNNLGPLRVYLREHYHMKKTFHYMAAQVWERNDHTK